MKNWSEFIFSDRTFDEKAQAVFQYQFENNPVYKRFCEALAGNLGRPGKQANKSMRFPLLPIRTFKDACVFCGDKQQYDLVFRSSGTGGMDSSTHRVANKEIYRTSLLKGFSEFYMPEKTVFLGYVPGYAENPHSSLIWMIKELIEQDDIKKSRFLPLDQPLSQGEIDDIAASGKQLILFGAAFGLLDLVERSSVNLPPNSIVIETGGMKTHRREMGRHKMHQILAQGFDVDRSRIHSEYGMCELLSQAYATGGKWFRNTSVMQFSIHHPDNPQQQLPAFQEGIIGVIDLANIHSCSFLLTADRGIMDRTGRLQVLGRWNPSDLRGCNFLIDDD